MERGTRLESVLSARSCLETARQLDHNSVYTFMSESFCKMLIASFEQRPDKIAMRVVGSEDEVYTFAELLSKIRSVAYRLGQENVAFGDTQKV